MSLLTEPQTPQDADAADKSLEVEAGQAGDRGAAFAWQANPIGGDSMARQRLAAALAAIAASLAVLVLGTRGFDTNDDPAMASFASGGFTGTPDSRWVFVDPLFSVPVTSLYRLTSTVPWYGVAYYVVHALAIVVLCDVLLRRSRDMGRVPTFVALATIIAVEPRFLLALSFTTTAFVASLASTVLAIDLITDGGWARRWRRGVVSIALLCVGISIRTESALAVLVLAVPVLVPVLSRRWRAAVPMVASVAAVLAINWAMLRYLSDNSYRAFLIYNQVRGVLHGTPRISESSPTPEILGKMGWDTVDRSLFGAFFYDDPKIFSLDALRIASAGTESAGSFVFKDLLEEVLFRYHWFFVTLLLLIVLALLARRWQAAIAATGVSLLGIGAMTWLEFSVRLPERVALPMWTSMVVLASLASVASVGAVCSGTETEAAPDSRQFQVVIGAWSLLLVCVAWTGEFGPFRTSERNRSDRAVLESELQVIEAGGESEIVLAQGSSLALQATDPLSNEPVLANPRILSFGWPTFSPMFEQRKARVELSDPMRSILHDPNVLFFSDNQGRRFYERFIAREAADPLGPPVLSPVRCTPADLEVERCLWGLDTETPARGPFSWRPSELETNTGRTVGNSRVGAPGIDEPGYLVFGPYVSLSSRRYRVTIDYRSDEPLDSSAGVFDVAAYRETVDGALEGGTVQAIDIPGTNGESGMVSIEFTGDASRLWEFRVRWDGESSISVDEVRSEPVG